MATIWAGRRPAGCCWPHQPLAACPGDRSNCTVAGRPRPDVSLPLPVRSQRRRDHRGTLVRRRAAVAGTESGSRLLADRRGYKSGASSLTRGVADGGGGRGGQDSRTFENRGGRPPQKCGYFSIFFLETYNFFAFSNIFKIKWPKFEKKLNFGGRWVWVPMNSTPPPPNQNFVAMPLLLTALAIVVSCCQHFPYVCLFSTGFSTLTAHFEAEFSTFHFPLPSF